MQSVTEIRSIYFLDHQGTPLVGFAGAEFPLYRTTDGGNTWKSIWVGNGIGITDIDFKDSLTGWLCTQENSLNTGYKTTDGGTTWLPISGVIQIQSNDIWYDSGSNGLFISCWSSGNTWASWDEGNSWVGYPSGVTPDALTGFAFNNSDSGVVAAAHIATQTNPWSQTKDGGRTWHLLSMDSECWQPLPLPNTDGTQFAITDLSGSVYRTDDLWNTWHHVFTFPLIPDARTAVSSGCIRGDSCRLFVQTEKGCFSSTDGGINWQWLYGPPDPQTDIYDRRFYVEGNMIFMSTVDSANATLWELDLDSLSPATIGISSRFDDGTQQTDLRPGDSVGITFVPGAGTLSATDSVELNIKYDTSTLSLDSLTVPAGWWIADSSSSGGILTVVLRTDSAKSLPDPLLHAEFRMKLTATLGTKTFIYLDSATSFFTPVTPCALPILSLGSRDSVEVDIPCAGDSTMYSHFALTFADSSSMGSLAPGDSVAVQVVPGAGTLAATDSVRLVLRYDPNAVSLSSLSVPTGWWISNSSRVGRASSPTSGVAEILSLTLRSDSAQSLPDPLLHAEFHTYLSPSETRAGSPTYATFIYLDSAQSFFPQTTPCAPTALSLQQPDSVELDFTGCGDSILEAEMNHEPPFTIESVVPNPASTAIAVTVSRDHVPGTTMEYELFDALGRVRLSGTFAGKSTSLDVTSLPNGCYYLRLSANGYAQSRSIAIER